MVDTEIWNEAYEGAKKLPSFIGDHVINLLDSIKNDFMWSGPDGARTQVYLTASPHVPNKRISGKYYHPVTELIEQTEYMKDIDMQNKFWDFSEEFLVKSGFYTY